jgi:ParB-like chromosome segregation protein Spo0J
MPKRKNPPEWTTIQYPLGKLIPWEQNPADISEHDAQHLAKSIQKFGLVVPFVAAEPVNGKEGLQLCDGHQRRNVELEILKLLPTDKVDVRVPDRKLTMAERKELAVRLRKNVGRFDNDMLLNVYERDELIDYGFNQDELENLGFIIPDFQPVGIDEQGRLDEKKKAVCPECGHEFTPK